MIKDRCHLTGLIAFIATLIAVVLLSKIGGSGADLAIMTGLCAVALAKAKGKGLRSLRSLGSLNRIEHPDMIGLATMVDARSVSTVPSINAVCASLIVGRQEPIAHVLGMRHIPQVAEAVICPVAIDMVEHPRLFAGCHLPNDPMRQIPLATNLAVEISELTEGHERRPASIPNVPALAEKGGREHFQRPLLPKKKSVVGVANKHLVEGRQIWQKLCSHLAVLSRLGQGRALLAQCFRPDFSNRIPFCSQAGSVL